MREKTIFPLYAPADAEKVRPILDALRAKGFRISEKAPAALLFLSEGFAADAPTQERFFAFESAGREIIPLTLDDAPQSELVRSALIAKNAIAASGRTPEEIAARVASAPGYEKKKSRLPLLLTAAALLIALPLAVWLWRGAPERAQRRERAEMLSAVQAKYGLSEEDLAEIRKVYVVSDGFYPLREDELEKADEIFPNYRMEDDGMHWYSHEDGTEIAAADWDAADWEVLRLMPNLESLIVVLANAPSLPDLSALEHLDAVQLIDSRIGDIGGLGGSTLTVFASFRCPIGDYSPLTRCERLERVGMEFDFLDRADLSGFSPPALKSANFGYSRETIALDLSGLGNCAALEELVLDHLPTVEDLDFLSGLTRLKRLTLEDLSGLRDISVLAGLGSLEYLKLGDVPALRDVSAIGKLKRLRQLDLGPCENVGDLSALRGCSALETFNAVGLPLVSDGSVLSELPKLGGVGMLSTPLRDTEYIESVASHSGDRVGLSLSGSIRDVSGLRYVRHFSSILLISEGEDLDYFMTYLRGAVGERLWLHSFSDSRLPEELPTVTDTLQIENCRFVDLRGLRAWRLRRLEITDGASLRSLEGIEALRSLGDGSMTFALRRCPLLSDLSALEGAYLAELSIADAVTVPQLKGLRVDRLRLENITELRDLGCLDGLDASQNCDFELIGLDALRDLSALRRFHGESLTVPPHLAEQAAELVESGNFQSFGVSYPKTGWVYGDEEVALLSLDELQTLPKSLLRCVYRLSLAGDRLFDRYDFTLEERFDENGALAPVLVENATREETPVEPGTLTALPDLSALGQLRELQICRQSLHGLEGVQCLTELEAFAAWSCPELEDASALFTLQGLRRLELIDCPLRSIEGVQNLTALEEIDLSHTQVSDLSALLELEKLRSVTVSPDMERAIASLEGAERSFDLIIRG